jgi:hypothetical protein
MKILMMGCEYSGTTTLAIEISKWIERVVGGAIHGGLSFHDHFKLIDDGHVGPGGPRAVSEDDRKESLAFSGRHRQSYKHYMMTYHTQPTFFADPHHLMIGMHFDDEVYGPKYLGYGQDQADFLHRLSNHFELKILEYGPDTILIQVKASPEAVRRRMRESPHPRALVQESDVEEILARFEALYQASNVGTLGRRFVLDTSSASVEETMAEFVEKIKSRLSDTDRLRILSRRLIGVV